LFLNNNYFITRNQAFYTANILGIRPSYFMSTDYNNIFFEELREEEEDFLHAGLVSSNLAIRYQSKEKINNTRLFFYFYFPSLRFRRRHFRMPWWLRHRRSNRRVPVRFFFKKQNSKKRYKKTIKIKENLFEVRLFSRFGFKYITVQKKLLQKVNGELPNLDENKCQYSLDRLRLKLLITLLCVSYFDKINLCLSRFFIMKKFSKFLLKLYLYILLKEKSYSSKTIKSCRAPCIIRTIFLFNRWLGIFLKRKKRRRKFIKRRWWYRRRLIKLRNFYRRKNFSRFRKKYYCIFLKALNLHFVRPNKRLRLWLKSFKKRVLNKQLQNYLYVLRRRRRKLFRKFFFIYKTLTFAFFFFSDFTFVTLLRKKFDFFLGKSVFFNFYIDLPMANITEYTSKMFLKLFLFHVFMRLKIRKVFQNFRARFFKFLKIKKRRLSKTNDPSYPLRYRWKSKLKRKLLINNFSKY
jgi:hypothetical protein